MKVQIEPRGDLVLVTVSGELTADSVPRFQETLKKCEDGEVRDFIIDLEGITAIDSAGLEALSRFQQNCEEQLGMVQFCRPDATLRKIFEITRLDRRFQIHDTLEEAVAAFAAAT